MFTYDVVKFCKPKTTISNDKNDNNNNENNIKI